MDGNFFWKFAMLRRKKDWKMDITISPTVVVSTIIFGMLSAYLAHKKGRNPYVWFAIGILFGIFGMFAVFFISTKKKASSPKTNLEPVLRIHGPKDKFWYYLDKVHQQQGPMSHDALTSEWKTGKIDLATFVWNEEMTEWAPLKETLKAD
jgi:hypothetical protein